MIKKSMDLERLNSFMKRCSQIPSVRYVTPTIHPIYKQIVSVTIHTSKESVEFTITNNPDENFNLNKAVNDYLDNL